MLSKRLKDVHRFLRNIDSFSNKQASIIDWDSDNLRWIKICLAPDAGPYSGGQYIFEVCLGKSYPLSPPEVTCLTPIYHPNIDAESENNVCVSILDDWQESHNMEDLVQGLLYLIHNPNMEDPLSPWFCGPEFDEEQFVPTVRKTLHGGMFFGVRFPKMVSDETCTVIEKTVETLVSNALQTALEPGTSSEAGASFPPTVCAHTDAREQENSLDNCNVVTDGNVTDPSNAVDNRESDSNLGIDSGGGGNGFSSPLTTTDSSHTVQEEEDLATSLDGAACAVVTEDSNIIHGNNNKHLTNADEPTHITTDSFNTMQNGLYDLAKTLKLAISVARNDSSNGADNLVTHADDVVFCSATHSSTTTEHELASNLEDTDHAAALAVTNLCDSITNGDDDILLKSANVVSSIPDPCIDKKLDALIHIETHALRTESNEDSLHPLHSNDTVSDNLCTALTGDQVSTDSNTTICDESVSAGNTTNTSDTSVWSDSTLTDTTGTLNQQEEKEGSIGGGGGDAPDVESSVPDCDKLIGEVRRITQLVDNQLRRPSEEEKDGIRHLKELLAEIHALLVRVMPVIELQSSATQQRRSLPVPELLQHVEAMLENIEENGENEESESEFDDDSFYEEEDSEDSEYQEEVIGQTKEAADRKFLCSLYGFLTTGTLLASFFVDFTALFHI